jgi:hypothetical protein
MRGQIQIGADFDAPPAAEPDGAHAAVHSLQAVDRAQYTALVAISPLAIRVRSA